MASLCNDPARCEVMNLGWGPHGHGPYLVRQHGYPPGSTDMRVQPFILQRDGRWLLNLVFATLPEQEQEAQLFHDLANLSSFLDQQASQPMLADDTLPAGMSFDEMQRRFENCTHRILRGMKSCAVTRFNT
jgi:hypothetical protein